MLLHPLDCRIVADAIIEMHETLLLHSLLAFLYSLREEARREQGENDIVPLRSDLPQIIVAH